MQVSAQKFNSARENSVYEHTVVESLSSECSSGMEAYSAPAILTLWNEFMNHFQGR